MELLPELLLRTCLAQVFPQKVELLKLAKCWDCECQEGLGAEGSQPLG